MPSITDPALNQSRHHPADDVGILSYLHIHASSGLEAIRTNEKSIGYAEFVQRVEQASAALSAAGIGNGSVVGVSIADEIENFVAAVALLCIGACQIVLATHDTDGTREDLAQRVGVSHHLAAKGIATVPLGARIDWPLPPVASLVSPSPGTVLLPTSGTTGQPNVVSLTISDLWLQAQRNPEYRGGRLFRPASIEHNNSRRHRLYCALLGGTNVFRPEGRYDVTEFCRRHAVTTLDIALIHAADILAAPAPGEFPAVEIRLSGHAVPIDMRRRIEAGLTPDLFVRYGTTESGTISCARPGEHEEDECVGQVAPDLELEIVGDGGGPVPAGTVGNIRIRGPGIARGYFADAGGAAARRFRDGWFWPGDVGMLKPDGSLVVLGRADDMINLNGINIFPAEIERVLERHEDVVAVAALGLQSAAHGQIPVAAVELRDGARVTERQLIGFARERLALRAPRRVVVMQELPRNSQGKIVRRAIAAMLERRGSS